ncbi:MAG: beta strand repeat-containing protein [Thermoguttaceae bacterium]
MRHKVSSFFEEHFCAIPRKFKLKSHFATDTNYNDGGWFLSGGRIDGGTIDATNGSLIATQQGGILDSVTLEGTLDMTGTGYWWSPITVTILNGITLDYGTIDLGGLSYSWWWSANVGVLNFGNPGDTNDQMVSGTGTIQFGYDHCWWYGPYGGYSSGLPNGPDYLHNNSTGLLTLGPHITISAGQTSIIDTPYGGSIENQGVIEETNPDSNYTGLQIDGLSDNQGTIEITAYNNNGSLDISGTNGWVNEGIIEGTNGSIVTLNGSGWTNEGNISIANGTLNLNGTWTNAVTGTITGGSSTVNLGSPVNIDPTDPSAPNYYWTNLGTVTIADSTVNLGGVFLTDSFDTMSLPGDTVNLTGTMDNSATDNLVSRGVLNLNSSTGSLTLLGGRIYQGEVVNSDGSGSTLIATTSGGTLDGVTLDVSMDLSGTNVYVWVQNGLTLNADQDLSGFGSDLDFVDWSNPQTVEIGGLVSGATITLGNSNANMWNFTSNSYAVTFGPGITINATGSNTWISGGPFINQGLIEETGGGVLTINSGANGWTNYGIISVTNEGTLNLYGTWTNYGTILVDPSTVSLGSSVNIDPTDPSAPSYYWTNLGTITIADGSTINLGGVFLSDTFDGMNLTGDTLNLTGTMDNSVAHNPAYHGVLNLNSSTGSLTLLGGRIYQGEVVNTDGSGSTLIATTSGGTLDGVTLDVSMDLSGTNVFVWVQNGLTLNADQDLSGVGSSLAFVDWSNPQTVEVGASVSGAAITLSGTWANMTIFTSNSYAVTFGTGITINANGPWNWIQGPFDNQGLIEETGGVLTIDIDNYNTYNNAGNLPSTAYSNFNMIPWTNEGTIQVTSGELLLGGPWTNTTSGTISATPGTLLYLGDNWNDYSNNYFSYYNTWTNNGTISTSNANVCLGGGLTYDSTNFQSIGGLGTDAVYLIGTLDNYGNTLTLTAGVTSATGSWYIDGGRIDGGTVASASPGADLIVTNMDWWSRGPKIGMLDGVTLDANLDMASNYGASLLVRDGLTLNGTISLGNPSGGGSATLYFDNCWNWGGRTLSGTGSIVFGGGSPSSLLVANWEFADYHQYWYYYAPLTIDSGITIDGPGTGITGNITGPIDNYADIEEAAGGTLAINFDNHNDFYYPGQWVNDSTGTIHVGGGSTLELGGAWSNYGTIAADPGANLYLGDNWNDTSVNDYFFYDNQYFYYNNTWANYGTISTTSTNVYLGGWLTYGNSNFQSIGGLGTDTVSLIGTLGNYWWNTLTLEAGVTSATGSWNIDGGRIYEGTVASASPGADLIATSAGGTLDGVTLDANLDMASNYGATITVRDGLTLNGTIYLGGPSGGSASLHFDDYWNWGGRPYQATVPSSSAAAARVP